jgi:hypothetical protein
MLNIYKKETKGSRVELKKRSLSHGTDQSCNRGLLV